MAPKPENTVAKLPESIAAIFDQAQSTLANHRKNCVALYKLHQQATAVTQPSKKDNAVKLVGERAFGDAFIDMVNRVLIVKKGPATADRVVRFVGSYVKFMNEKGVSILPVACVRYMGERPWSSSYMLLYVSCSSTRFNLVSSEKAKAPGDSCSARLNEEDEDTFASRFLSRLLDWLSQGFIAKNKTTRYRSVAIVSELIAHLGELE
jgi:condensin complex subunit 3